MPWEKKMWKGYMIKFIIKAWKTHVYTGKNKVKQRLFLLNFHLSGSLSFCIKRTGKKQSRE